MPLLAIIVWITAAGIVIMLGAALTIRRALLAERPPVYPAIQNQVMPQSVRCEYCGHGTSHFINVYDSHGYNAMCLDCQYHSGIRCADGSIDDMYFYQVEQVS